MQPKWLLALSSAGQEKSQWVEQEAPEVGGRSFFGPALAGLIFGISRGSEDSVPDAQGGTEICRGGRSRMLVNSRMVPVVENRRNKEASERAEGPWDIGMGEHG